MSRKGTSVFFTLQFREEAGCSVSYIGDPFSFFSDSDKSIYIREPERFLDLVLDEERESVTARLGAAIRSGRSLDTGFNLRREGRFFRAELIISIRREEEEGVGWDGVIRFIPSVKNSFIRDLDIGKTNRLLKEVIMQSPVPIGVLSPSGKVLIYNKPCADVMGLDFHSSRAEGLNYFRLDKPWLIVDENNRGCSSDDLPLMRAMRDGISSKAEVQIIKPDGTRRWLIINGSPIYDKNGELIAGLAVFPDITRQKETELALQERVRELDCLYGISHLAEKEDISTAELLQGALGIMLKSWKFPHLISVRIVYRDDVFTGDAGSCDDTAFLFCQKSDITIYGSVEGFVGVSYCQPVSHSGKVVVRRELNLLNDIASRLSKILEKKQSEKALQESEALFRSYIESAPDGIFLADRNGLYKDVNNTACQITGYSKEELIGMPLTNLTYFEDIELTKVSFARCIREGRTTNSCRFRKKDGEIRHWIVDAVKLDNDSFLGFTRDNTEQVKLEEQLRQMEKMDAIGQLAGGIAHDFNNQIAVIMGYSEMLVSQLKDPRLLKFARNILAGAHRSDDLTRKLLAFAHKGLYENKAVNLHRIIGEAVDILTHSMDRKISLKLKLQARRPFTSGDPTQIQNILINLALNARDAMPEGGTLTFYTENRILDEQYCRSIPYQVEPGDFVRVSVSDTGIGMDESTQSRIFEPFFTTKSVGKGTGMGLASVYGAVSNHKAVIEVDSRPGEGTTFHLFFPVDDRAAVEQHLQKAPVAASGDATIMLVDDDELVRAMGETILEELGYRVVPFSDGMSALEYLHGKQGSVDLIILDMIMPGLGGKDVYRFIREINGSVPVILSSGFSLSGEVQQLLDEGAAAFISKPFEISSFSAAVSRALK